MPWILPFVGGAVAFRLIQRSDNAPPSTAASVTRLAMLGAAGVGAYYIWKRVK